jgi:hypothetical protein
VKGCLRCGCLVVWLPLLAAVGATAFVFWQATRPVGPAYQNGAYVVTLPGGGCRIDTISGAGTAAFDAKIAPRFSPADVAAVLQGGVDFSEQELNSKLATQLLLNPLRWDGWDVQRVFVELHPSASTGYVYLSGHGTRSTLAARLTFTVAGNATQIGLSDVHAGKLPLGPTVPWLLDATGTAFTLQRLLQVALPVGVRAIEPREGSLHATIGFAAPLHSAELAVPSPDNALGFGTHRIASTSLF